MFEAVAGGTAPAETVRRWSGRALDPAVAAVFLDAPAELLRISDPEDLWAAVADAEPEPRRCSGTTWLWMRRWPRSVMPLT
jgi:hypothetical protein